MLVWMPGIVLTNDGHAVLREIDVGHPAAKVTASTSDKLCVVWLLIAATVITISSQSMLCLVGYRAACYS